MKNIINTLYYDEQILIIQTLTGVREPVSIAKIAEIKASLAQKEVGSTASKLSTNELLQVNKTSYGHYNLGLHVGDDAQQVYSNRCNLLAELNKSTDNKVEKIHWLNQVHGNTVVDIDSSSHHINSRLHDADAMVAATKGIALAIMTADCVPVVLYCPNTKQVAAIHAGWQGLAQGIIKETVATLKSNALKNSTEVGADSSNQVASGKKAVQKIQAWIGACISGDNYEVTTDVLDKLIDGTLLAYPQLDRAELIASISKTHADDNKVWLDLPALTNIQLAKLGVEVVSAAPPCSYANTCYYSHRRATHLQQVNTGRMAMIVIKL